MSLTEKLALLAREETKARRDALEAEIADGFAALVPAVKAVLAVSGSPALRFGALCKLYSDCRPQQRAMLDMIFRLILCGVDPLAAITTQTQPPVTQPPGDP